MVITVSVRGYGEAHGAVSVLNAIPTGFGGAVGIDLGVRAWVSLGSVGFEGYTLTNGVRIPIESRILRAIGKVVSEKVSGISGLKVVVESEIPFASGLKGSSALVNSIIKAVLDALGHEVRGEEVAYLGVEASRLAGITVTGALDDSLATMGSGVYITNNYEDVVIARYESPCYRVAIHIPSKPNPIEGLDRSIFDDLRAIYYIAVGKAITGDWLGAMKLNGYLTARAIGYGEDLLQDANSINGVIAAGVSGKGPAVFAILGRDIELWSDRGKVIYTRLLGGRSC